mmetsp:Transcript_10687/g.23510  ORF Transcript_10687/g.23510 Transcript_10687/m.23510 type:complete len:138 (+) Transcript_10687:112-525(+)
MDDFLFPMVQLAVQDRWQRRGPVCCKHQQASWVLPVSGLFSADEGRAEVHSPSAKEWPDTAQDQRPQADRWEPSFQRSSTSWHERRWWSVSDRKLLKPEFYSLLVATIPCGTTLTMRTSSDRKAPFIISSESGNQAT